MLYRFQDIFVTINGSGIACTSAGISFENSLDADRTVYDNINYKASNGTAGALTIEYYVTGKDFLYEQAKDIYSLNKISGNFAGLYFSSGYISSHSIDVVNNNLVLANCAITFYDELKGEITTGNVDYGDFTVGHAARSYASNNLGVGNDFRFSLSNNLKYSIDYKATSHIPRSIKRNSIETNFSIQGNDIGNFVYWSGESGVAELTIANHRGESLQSYGITGQVVRKNVEVNGEFIVGSVNIIQVR